MSRLHVRWEHFQNNVSTGFSYFQQKEEFVDMTLAADGHTVKVHKNILALASPYIKEMLQTVPCTHPVLFLNNITAQVLIYILEYIYTGEVVIPPANAKEFFKACKSLQIAGICKIPALPKINSVVTETDNKNKPTSAKNDLPNSETLNGTQTENVNPCEVMNNDIIDVDQHESNIHPASDSYLSVNVQEPASGTCGNNDNSQCTKSDVALATDDLTTNLQNNENNDHYHEYGKSNIPALDSHQKTNLEEIKIVPYSENECQYVNSDLQPTLDFNSAIDPLEAQMDTYDENYECQNENIKQPTLAVHPATDSQEADINMGSANDECQYLNSNTQPLIHDENYECQNENITQPTLAVHPATDSQEADINMGSATDECQYLNSTTQPLIQLTNVPQDTEMDISNANEYQYPSTENNAQSEFEGHSIINIQENECNYAQDVSGELKNKESFIASSNSNVDQPSHNYAIDVQIVKDDEQPNVVLRQVDEPLANAVKNTSANVKPYSIDFRTSPLLYSISNRGCLQIVLNRFVYNEHFNSHGQRKKRWRCIDYRLLQCKALIDTQDNVIVSRQYHHLHPYHDKKIIERGHENNIFATRDEALEALHSRTRSTRKKNEQRKAP